MRKNCALKVAGAPKMFHKETLKMRRARGRSLERAHATAKIEARIALRRQGLWERPPTGNDIARRGEKLESANLRGPQEG